MKIKREREFWCGIVFVAVGLSFAWAAGTWPLGHRASPGAGFFGLCLALALTTLGGLVLFMATAIESAGGDPLARLGSRAVAFVLLALLAVGLLLPRLGLVATSMVATVVARLAWSLRGGTGGGAMAPAPRSRAWGRAMRVALVHALVSGAAAWLACHVLLALHVPLWPAPLAAWSG